jgi:hypothetical protein
MAVNTLLTPNWYTTDVATGFLDSTKLFGRFNRDVEDEWSDLPKGAKIGDTVNVRIEQRWVVTEGQAYQQQALLNQSVPLTINHQYNIGSNWSTSQATLEVEQVQSRYSRPTGKRLAAKWDRASGEEVYKSVFFSVGTPGTAITSNLVWQDAVALLQEQAVPDDDLMAVVSPNQQANLVASNTTSFNPTQQIGEYFKSGKFGAAALGVKEWFYDPLLPMHTTGTFTSSTPKINGSGLTGSTLATDGWGTYAFKRGDVFTIAGVYATNPLEQDLNMGRLMQFSMTADLAGSTTATLAFTPAIVTSGPLQNVAAGPADDAAINFLGSTGTVNATMSATASRQNLLFHPSAFAVAMVDLDRDLAGAKVGFVSDKETRIRMRTVEQYNAQTDQKISRTDTLGGIAPILPYFAVRCWGAS